MPKRKTTGAALRGPASPDGGTSGSSTELAAAREVSRKYDGEKRAVIQILQDLQERFCWLSPETLEAVALVLDVSLAHVYSVATFYKSFSLEPRGRHICTVCMGTACHVRGGAAILEHIERMLGIRPGQTTSDGRVSLERVNCLGACALAPLAVVDGRYFGQMNESKANEMLKPILEGESLRPASTKVTGE